ncbi:Cytoplasmic dynein 1 light intermediate chain 2 [Amphibalanus amphitrite]|uniref:Dynein light intermediate chain n=1 Tax=Amphibalanus amphitrite TaxID=1232801 RepID=A0A6A4WNP0_AMPAM|nr:cytoplasmic dynein 1 light intermediate chain 1-like [Amphibalanus amphitrite]KAF0303728.1 Cytoplasmic dynein 1 light intermediate chain 2 [Amphibalanus amphitrite]
MDSSKSFRDENGSDGGEGKKTDNKEGIWSSILTEVVSAESTKLPADKQVVVLGNNQTGKTTLVAKLQGNEDPKKGSGLEYAHILVRDEYRDATTRLSVWMLDGDPAHAHLLQYALGPEAVGNTALMLTVAMTTPWDILDQLHAWAGVIQDHLDQLNLSADLVRERQHKVQRRWQEYIEPGDELEAASPAKRLSQHLGEEDGEVLLPLGENTLTRNLGMDVIVVVTKTDYMATLETDHDYKDEHFDFIQQYVRKFCLQYGAALFYTSVKEDKNCDLLYKYLTHRIYGFPFRTPALVVEKDAVFIPAGWDNDKKISILYENMQSIHPEAYYTDVISRPAIKKTLVRDTELQAEEEQTFLARQQQQLLSSGGASPGPAGAPRPDTPSRLSTSGVQKTPERRGTASPSIANNSSVGKKLDPTKPGAGVTSEGVLANFFNSLLNKKAGSPGGLNKSGTDSADTSLVRSDAAAELDRLTRTKKTSTPLKSADTSGAPDTDC